MKQYLLVALLMFMVAAEAFSQSTQPPANQQPTPTRRQDQSFEISDYGVEFQADPRLVITMAALEAAGFDPIPVGNEPSAFRVKLRKDIAGLDPDLRQRLKTFFDRNKLPAPATMADQASRYVSLALALGPPPMLDAPDRSEDMPAGLLEVLDFAPLVQEFYKKSGIDDQLVNYVRAYQAEGDRLRSPTTEMIQGLLTYLHTRPITTSNERVEVKSPGKKKSNTKTYSIRTKERRFFILPDLLASRGAVNFRIIGDDYYVIVPEGTDPANSEMRRAYLQFVIDALVLRFNKDISLRREAVRQLLTEREQAGAEVSPDVFLSVARSMVTAADARYDELRRMQVLSQLNRVRLTAAKTEADRAALAKSNQAEIQGLQDETTTRLADEYERGAVLSFYFSDQLKGIESAGFDIANFFPDMLASFDPIREGKRPAEYAEARTRGVAARVARAAARKSELENLNNSVTENPRDAALVKDLSVVEETLRNKNYTEAESKLRSMMANYPREPRIFFALGQTASLAATDATDEPVRDERLNRALGQYRLAIEASSPDTDKALRSRAYEAMGRINAFIENKQEALKHFDEAIKLGEIRGGAYREALEGKRRLTQP